MAKEIMLVASHHDSSRVLGVIGILREAFMLPLRNGKLMPSLFLLTYFPFSLLIFLHYILVGPLMKEIEDEDDILSKVSKHIKLYLCIELLFVLAFLVVSISGITAIVYSSAVTYTGKSMSLKELLIKFIESWKRTMVTLLCISLFTIFYLVIVVLTIVGFYLYTVATVMATLSLLVGFSALIFYHYLSVFWVMGLVISVIEDCYGTRALGKAKELIRGRKVQGFVIMVLLELLSSPISVSFIIITSDDDLGGVIEFAFGSVATFLFCMAKLFTFVVYTIFYYECKRSNGEIELGFGYRSVPTHTHFDVFVP